MATSRGSLISMSWYGARRKLVNYATETTIANDDPHAACLIVDWKSVFAMGQINSPFTAPTSLLPVNSPGLRARPLFESFFGAAGPGWKGAAMANNGHSFNTVGRATRVYHVPGGEARALEWFKQLKSEIRVSPNRTLDKEGAGNVAENLGQTLNTHVAGLRRYAMALLGDPIEADDLVQDCLARALSRAHVWPRVRDQRAYLFTILHNMFVDQVSRQNRRGPHASIEDFESHIQCKPTQHERLEVRDLKRALGELSEKYRAVVLLVGLEGMSYQQTADTLGVPIGTVMSRLSRGRRILREIIDGRAAEPRARPAARLVVGAHQQENCK